MEIKERLARVQLLIEEAAKRSGRPAKEITLVAVTKGVPPERVLEAKEAGLRLFGENRIQEAKEKIPKVVDPAVEWHLVGHLQSNKVSDALSLFSLIHSVDSVRLAERISRESEQRGRVTPALLEVNISGEPQKYGFLPEAIYTAIDAIKDFPGIRISGLMGMAPNDPDKEKKREAFKKLRNLFSVCRSFKGERLEMKYLSMGMSGDFETAIEEGSNMVRLGRILFG